MNNKIIVYKEEARAKLSKGAQQLADAVVSTLGPRSKNVAINQFPFPWNIHDGVNVAKSIKLRDPFEDMGAAMIREAASKTSDLAGDGTTTATLLANTLFQEGLKVVSQNIMEGRLEATDAQEFREKLEKVSEIIVAEIQKKTHKVKKLEEKINIATISAASEEIGKMVANALEEIGEHGHVIVEEGEGFETTIERQQGFEFNNGYISQYLVTDPNRMIAEYKDAYLLLTDQIITDALTIVPIITECMKQGKPLVIVAGDIQGPALHAINAIKNRPETAARIVAVIAPEFGEIRKQMLNDMAMLFGASLISGELGMKIVDTKISDLGRVKSFFASDKITTMTPENPDQEEIEERCKTIQEQIKAETDPYRKARLEQRLSKLSQGVAVISVGGASKPEVDDKIERVKDSVYALKAAISDGMVAGGGIVLYEIAEDIHDGIIETPLNEVEKQVVINTLKKPFETLLTNAGVNISDVLKEIAEVPVVINESGEAKKTKSNIGYDVVGKKVGDMFKMGIVDPAKVTTLAVKNAFSVAGMMMITDCLIADEPDQGVQKIKVVNNI